MKLLVGFLLVLVASTGLQAQLPVPSALLDNHEVFLTGQHIEREWLNWAAEERGAAGRGVRRAIWSENCVGLNSWVTVKTPNSSSPSADSSGTKGRWRLARQSTSLSPTRSQKAICRAAGSCENRSLMRAIFFLTVGWHLLNPAYLTAQLTTREDTSASNAAQMT